MISSSRFPLCSFFFFSMIQRPPRSTLFPTRRSSDLQNKDRVLQCGRAAVCCNAADGGVHRQFPLGGRHEHRSEEHTSELQSRVDLVCRLLLEKKNLLDVSVGGSGNHWYGGLALVMKF